MKTKHLMPLFLVPLFLAIAIGCRPKPAAKNASDSPNDTTPTVQQVTNLTDTGDVIDIAPMPTELGPVDDVGLPMPPSPPSIDGDNSIPGLPPIPGDEERVEEQ
jgi:hypothetical protein